MWEDSARHGQHHSLGLGLGLNKSGEDALCSGLAPALIPRCSWLAVFSSRCLGSPTMRDCDLELGAKISPFSLVVLWEGAHFVRAIENKGWEFSLFGFLSSSLESDMVVHIKPFHDHDTILYLKILVRQKDLRPGPPDAFSGFGSSDVTRFPLITPLPTLMFLLSFA